MRVRAFRSLMRGALSRVQYKRRRRNIVGTGLFPHCVCTVRTTYPDSPIRFEVAPRLLEFGTHIYAGAETPGLRCPVVARSPGLVGAGRRR
jgi:hypothetical protein